MGCWNETCMLTNLPILTGDEVIAFLIQRNYMPNAGCNPDGNFRPITLPIVGRYDDYGGLEDIEKNSAMLRLLAGTELYTKSPIYGYRHMDLSKLTVQDDWEVKLRELLTNARQEYLFIKDSHASTGFSLVYLVMMRKEFIDFGIDAVKTDIPDICGSDCITYRIGLADVLRTAIREKLIVNDDIKMLTGLNIFMEMNRIAWHPTFGSGSQQAIDDDCQLGFYRKILQTAEHIADPES